MDNLSREKRSYIMSQIKSKNTKPEMLLRKTLFNKGLRYRKHYRLPGRPDIVFVSKKLVIFVNGCFWHGHGCKIDNKPKSNKYFWEEKIKNNKKRDEDNYHKLETMGWKYYVVWECSINKDINNEVDNIIKILYSCNKVVL